MAGRVTICQDGTERTDRLLEERLEQCRKGETLRNVRPNRWKPVECRRIDKSGREHKGLLTLSLLTDERALGSDVHDG